MTLQLNLNVELFFLALNVKYVENKREINDIFRSTLIEHLSLQNWRHPFRI